MKTRIWLFLMAVVAMSCTREAMSTQEQLEEAVNNVSVYYPEKVYARIESSDGSDTKVFADENLKVLWDNDDRISLFNKYTYNKQYRFTGNTGDNSGEFVDVNPGAVVTGNALDYVYSVYPYKTGTTISNAGIISLRLPAEQTYRENTFGLGANTMVSATTNTELLFKNLCGYLVLKLYGDDVSVSSITLIGNDNESLAGDVNVTAPVGGVPSLAFSGSADAKSITLSCPTPVTLGSTAENATIFWLAVPPTTFSNGFKITVTDSQNGTFEKSISAEVVIPRNTTLRMKALEVMTEPPFDPHTTPLCFEAIEDGVISVNNPLGKKLSYSTDGTNWSENLATGRTDINVAFGDKVYFKGTNTSLAVAYGGTKFECSARTYIYGNIMSLLSSTDYATKTDLEEVYTFFNLFRDNTHILNHPNKELVLPATTLAENCYLSMFRGCTSLTIAPDLPATTLAKQCYNSMFFDCTSLTTAPELPATALAEQCYEDMFRNCTGLTRVPKKLPATTLAKRCCESMFYGCTSLTIAPELPATTLAENCYLHMFVGCASLTAAPELPATTLAEGCYYCMFYGCASLTAAPELPATTLAENCYGSMFSDCTSLTTAPELPATTLAERCYSGMFSDTNLTVAPELPVTTLAESCYSGMFSGCTSLTVAPELPATTLAKGCYQNMFDGCTSLTAAPELLATTLAEACYQEMFDGCTSLTVAPELPATTLAVRCYAKMFYGCTSLTTAPELLATTLVEACYQQMFYGCTSLNYIKCLAQDKSAWQCTSIWLYNVASTGTFIKSPSAEWSRDYSGIPSGWTIK